MKKYNLGIVGGSASGLAAAINAKRIHKDMTVIIFERMPRLGKKILSTGNGRCNMTNLNACCEDYNNCMFVGPVFKKYPPSEVIKFFNSLGLYTFFDECGRVYPRSNTAASVLDALRFEVEKLGIEYITEYDVDKIRLNKSLFLIDDEYCCEKLIIAAGGKSASPQGSNGSGYTLAESFGHKITRLYPALVPLNTKTDNIKGLKGIRAANVSLSLKTDSRTINRKGEILFTDNGISGIAAMEIAAAAEKGLRKGSKPIVNIDFLPEFSSEELKNIISEEIEIRQSQSLDNLLNGLLPKQLGIQILKMSSVYYGGGIIEVMSDNMIEIIVGNIKSFSVEIIGTKGFLNSQVTSGGVELSEVDCKTMQSKIVDNLYFCGEILDIDAPCGGYNLQWAFASGLTAGELK